MQDIVQILTSLILEGYVGLFIACFIINMIPFISPSNMVLAGSAMILLFPGVFSIELAIQIGIVVALSATLSKLVLYWMMRGSRIVLSESMLEKVEYEKARVQKWGAIALFVSAGSPVPDDPIVIYCGLTQYGIPKFLLSYSLGKVAVTIPGALIASAVSALFGDWPTILGSIALTAIILGIIFKRKTETEETKTNTDSPVEDPKSSDNSSSESYLLEENRNDDQSCNESANR
ncbi:MAG: VTT domain-containing protein [Candidatus Hodarchaeota archaeon]